MTITLNGKPCEVDARSLSDVLVELGYGAAKIATAVNGTFVPATQRAFTELEADDAIEVVAPRQGG